MKHGIKKNLERMLGRFPPPVKVPCHEFPLFYSFQSSLLWNALLESTTSINYKPPILDTKLELPYQEKINDYANKATKFIYDSNDRLVTIEYVARSKAPCFGMPYWNPQPQEAKYRVMNFHFFFSLSQF